MRWLSNAYLGLFNLKMLKLAGFVKKTKQKNDGVRNVCVIHPIFIILFCFTISFKWTFYFSCLNIYVDLIHVIFILFTFYSAQFNNNNNLY